MSWNFIILTGLLFATVFLFSLGLLRFWSTYWGANASLIKKRLRVLTGELNIEAQSLVKTRSLSKSPQLNTLLKKIPHINGFDAFLTQAGVKWNVSQFLLGNFILWVITYLLLFTLGIDLRISWFISTSLVLLNLTYLQKKRVNRVYEIEKQLPITLDLMARAMQAGHAFSSALLIVGKEGRQPIRGEFQTTFDEINFGIPTETALHHLTLRVASSDLRFFVVAVLIQLETGGNLTEILKSLANLIRDRQRIAGTVRVLTAEGRLSAWILALLPFLIGLILSAINPEFISKLWTDQMGVQMLQISLGLMLIGIVWMWRMVRIRI